MTILNWLSFTFFVIGSLGGCLFLILLLRERLSDD